MFSQLPTGDVELIDLSIGLEADADSEPFPPSIDYYDHRAGAEKLVDNLREAGFEDIAPEDFPDGLGLAWEEVTAIPHTGTHLDAPWHYGPVVAGEPARTIDEIPLEWCLGEAVVLDFTWKEPRTEISTAEVVEQLDGLGHTLTEGEIVLIQTGADELWGTADYLTDFPGMGAEATRYLVDRGAKVIGIDAYGFDKPFNEMGRRFSETGESDELWPAHLAVREMEYCQIEKMANLNQLPRRTGVPIAAFPVTIARASAGWVRPVAFVGRSG
jgi:kynurenine formamidase